jgi:hypothetical protein
MTMFAFAFLQYRRLKKARGKRIKRTAASTKLVGRPSHRSTAAEAMPALPKMDP